MAEHDEGLAWQTGVWDRMSAVYGTAIDPRFVPVVEHCVRRADIRAGDAVLDLGTGTGSVALRAGAAVGPNGRVTAVDVSPEMVAVARRRVGEAGLHNVTVAEGRAEEIPAGDGEFDVLIASLSLMYAIDREASAREAARVLRPGGRFVAAAWGGPDVTDIVRFQQTAGAFAPPPPVPGVGPGALADPTPFLAQLDAAGIDATVEPVAVDFEFADFEQAWDALAAVTAAALAPERRDDARRAVQEAMWPDPSAPRLFRNTALLIGGTRR